MSTNLYFDFKTRIAPGAKPPRVALADIFELPGDGPRNQPVVEGVVVNLKMSKDKAPTSVEVKPGNYLVRLRTPEGQLLTRRVQVEADQRNSAIVFLPESMKLEPDVDRVFYSSAEKAAFDYTLRDVVVDSEVVAYRKPAVPRDWWSALPMVNHDERVSFSNLPGFHAGELVEAKHDFMGVARLQARSSQTPAYLQYTHQKDLTTKLVGNIDVIQGAKLYGNRHMAFAKWKSPLRHRASADGSTEEGKGARNFALSYRAEDSLRPLQVACVPGRWVTRSGEPADVFASYYERNIGNTKMQALRVEVDDPEFGGLIDFLQQGELSGSALVLSKASIFLYEKWLNPYASAAAGYVLIQAHRHLGVPEDWRQWVLNLAHRYSSLPDGAILFTTLLLQSRSDALENLHYEDRKQNHFKSPVSAALEAVRRGPPLFRHGLKMMATNLAILEGEAEHSWEAHKALPELQAASEYVGELSMRVDPNQPFCVFDVRADYRY